MGVTLNTRGIALKLAFQFVNASAELVVELTFLNKFITLLRERALCGLQLFRERSDKRLRLSDQLCASIFELIFKTVNDTNDSVNTLIIKPLDVSVAVHG